MRLARGGLVKALVLVRSLRPSKKSIIPVLSLLTGLVLIAIGGSGAWQWYKTTHHKNPVVSVQPAQTVTVSTGHPDETPIKTNNYTVPAGQPRQITISSINAAGFIQKVGTDQNNAVGVPSNIHMAGWYTKSPLPGDPGVSIIDGHIQGFYDAGVFKNLGKTKKGDRIGVEFGDHSWKYFTVIAADLYSVDTTSAEQYKQLPGISRQLTVITCGGTYHADTHSYDKRVVVRASLVD